MGVGILEWRFESLLIVGAIVAAVAVGLIDNCLQIEDCILVGWAEWNWEDGELLARTVLLAFLATPIENPGGGLKIFRPFAEHCVIKVALIGAGSVVFSRNLTGDILGFPEFKNATFSYMDIDGDRLEVGANLCRKVAKALDAHPTIEATLDRRKALDGADFVINMVQIGGFNSTLVDFEIPRKYGLNFTIADTTGPGGLFRALRTFPMLSGLARTMMEVCPRATLLELFQSDEHEHADHHAHERHSCGGAVPQRAGNA